jgi:hypothetical protein
LTKRRKHDKLELCFDAWDIFVYAMLGIAIIISLYLFGKKIEKDLEDDANNVDEFGYVIEDDQEKTSDE